MSADDVIRHLTDAALHQNGFVPAHLASEQFSGKGLHHFHHHHHAHMQGDGFFSALKSAANGVYKFIKPIGSEISNIVKPALKTAGNQMLQQGQTALVNRLKAM